MSMQALSGDGEARSSRDREIANAERQLAAGRPKEAERLLRRVLKRRPAHAWTLKLYGDCLVQSGRLDEALASYDAAVRIEPGLVAAYWAAGQACEAGGRLVEAGGLYRRASELAPAFAEPRFRLGAVLKALGRAEEALECYRGGLALQPDFVPGHVNLGNLALALGRLELAEAAYRRALELEPGLVRAHCNLAMVLRERERWEEALACARRAVELDPADAESLSCLGSIEKSLGAAEAAIGHCREAVAIVPRGASYHFNLGEALRSAGQVEAAAESYLAAVRLEPNLRPALVNLAVIREEQGEVEAALNLCERIRRADPSDAAIRVHLARLYERLGRLGEAWDLLEAGFATGLRVPDRRFAQPRWHGEDLDGRRLLVWREQGLGDEIRFASCYPDLLAQTGGCTIEADPRLLPILARSFPQADVRPDSSADAAPEVPFDCHAPAGSLPRFYRRRGEDFPDRAHLRPDPARQGRWRDRLRDDCPGLKVGLCWRSGRLSRERSQHYAALADLAPVLAVPGVSFVLLQYDDCAAELAEVERQRDIRIHRWPGVDLKDDLEEVFALVAELDLVISATTAVADIAGALGTEAWVFYAGASQPNYVSKSRWYGNRLIGRHWRQTWSELFHVLAADLTARAGTKR